MSAPTSTIAVAHELLSLSRQQLAEAYGRGKAEAIPDGRGSGTALFLPGTPFSATLAWLTRAFSWKGKQFNRAGGGLHNLITPFGLRAIAADVYLGPSLMDGEQAVILDYSRTSLLARWVRDEIREVGPGVYLGYAYVFRRRTIAFALEFAPNATG